VRMRRVRCACNRIALHPVRSDRQVVTAVDGLDAARRRLMARIPCRCINLLTRPARRRVPIFAGQHEGGDCDTLAAVAMNLPDLGEQAALDLTRVPAKIAFDFLKCRAPYAAGRARRRRCRLRIELCSTQRCST
jgi:hypothetical protein